MRTFCIIAVVSGFILGIAYYILTLSALPAHITYDIGVDPTYVVTCILVTLVVAILGGINIALVIYNIKVQRASGMKKSGTSAIFGGALTAFTPGCPACTTSLTAILGIVGGLAIFPLQGLELKFVSIAALSFSIWWAMRNINKASCCTMESN